MTRFVIVRHGETQWNVESRIQGHHDSALTPSGIAQAEALARRLAAERFEALISSDLGRALETAQRIAARCGQRVLTSERLRERNFGVAEGLTYGELDYQFPEVFSQVRETDPDYAIPGGESRRAFHERVKSAFEDLAHEYPQASIAVVAHGGVLAALYRLIHAIPLALPRRIPITNGSYNVVVFKDANWSLEAWGDIAHLGGDASIEET